MLLFNSQATKPSIPYMHLATRNFNDSPIKSLGGENFLVVYPYQCYHLSHHTVMNGHVKVSLACSRQSDFGDGAKRCEQEKQGRGNGEGSHLTLLSEQLEQANISS